MELGGYGFEKSDLLKLTEQIYNLKKKKQDLELTLNNEEFHYRYIPQRKEGIIHRIIFFSFVSVAITTLIFCIIGNIFGWFLVAFLLYADVRLLLEIVKMLSLFIKTEQTVFVAQKTMDSFQKDEEDSKKRIEMLKEEIASIDGQISCLEEQQKELIEQKQKGEDFLRTKGVLFDDNPNIAKGQGKFSLREESIAMGNEQDIFDFYLREEQYIHNYILQVEGKLQRIDKEIAQIDVDFIQVKKTVLIFFIIYILLILVQGGLSGAAGIAISVVCTTMTVFFILYLEKKCAPPIVKYLVEHENSLIQEYAFCHNMVPIRMKRQEIMEKKKSLELELEGIKTKKQALNI